MADEERPNKMRKLGHLMEEEDPAASVGVTPAYTTPIDSPAPTTEDVDTMDSDAAPSKLRNRHLDLEDAAASVGVTPSYTSPVDSPAPTEASEALDSDARPAKLRKLAHLQEDAAASVGVTPSYTTPVDSPGGPMDASNSETAIAAEEASGGTIEEPKISKNQLKKQRRHERWESGREDRKLKRKEKAKEKKERRREAWAAEHQPDENGEIPKLPSTRPSRNTPGHGTQVPITVVFDCDWEDLMFDAELKSLGLQITRCYSDNRKAAFRTHLAISSWGGKMKERFEGILGNQHTSWKGFKFFEEDFVEVSKKSREWMTGPRGGIVAGAMKSAVVGKDEEDGKEAAETEDKPSDDEGEIIYLSSESDNVLTTLKPNSTYIIGGLVDKNRHKGVCHKRALERGIKTAKLPIGEFLEMKSRQVLVTNHVLEIMLKWLECGDWGKAFMAVLPERKGAKLKGDEGKATEDNEGDQEMAESVQEADFAAVPVSEETAAETAQAAAETAKAVVAEEVAQ